MRVRLNRTLNDDRRDSPTRARLRLVRDEAPVEPRDVTEEFADERRMRDSGGPDDTATYHCACGYVFESAVSTSVACPHCGSGQAW
jgi:predicted Zn-ribbon and HTH transcriptional regulator